MKRILTIIILISIVLPAFADEQQASVNAPSSSAATVVNTSKLSVDESMVEKNAKKFVAQIALQGQTDLKNTSSEQKDYGVDSEIALGYKFTENYSGFIIGGVSQPSTERQDVEMANTKLQVRYKNLPITNTMNWSPRAYVTLATNETAREEQFYRGAIGIEPKIIGTLGLFDYELALNLGKNFHEFNRAHDGTQNVEYVARTTGTLGYNITERFSTSVTGRLAYGRTYLGDLKQSFVFNTEVAVAIIPSSMHPKAKPLWRHPMQALMKLP